MTIPAWPSGAGCWACALHPKDTAQSQRGLPISRRTRVLLGTWRWRSLRRARLPSCRSAWQSTNTVGAGGRGPGAEDRPRLSRTLSGSLSAPVLLPGALPSLRPPPSAPSPQGDSQMGSGKREAVMSRLSLGLRGRCPGNGHVGHWDSPKGSWVIFTARCSSCRHATPQAEWSLLRPGGRWGLLSNHGVTSRAPGCHMPHPLIGN